jgi:hypothetical protein
VDNRIADDSYPETTLAGFLEDREGIGAPQGLSLFGSLTLVSSFR